MIKKRLFMAGALFTMAVGMVACGPIRNSGHAIPIEIDEEDPEAVTIADSGTVDWLEYELTERSGDNGVSKLRGYYYYVAKTPDSPYYFTICSGEKMTGGYGIELTNIQVSADGDVKIFVKETSPAMGDVVTEAITYPSITIALKNVNPDKVTVIDADGNEMTALELTIE